MFMGVLAEFTGYLPLAAHKQIDPGPFCEAANDGRSHWEPVLPEISFFHTLSVGFDLLAQRPYETGELARQGHDDFVARQATG